MNRIGPVSDNVSLNKKIRKNINPVTPLSPQNSPSFKGGVESLITEADKKVFDVFSQHYGDVGDRVGRKLAKLANSSKVLEQGARFSLDKGVTSIKEKQIGQSVLENIVFPFVNIPLYFASWVMKKAQSNPNLKEGARKIYNEPILRIPRKLNELDQKTDIIKGMYNKTKDVVEKFAASKNIDSEELFKMLNDKTQADKPIVQEANEFIKENLYKVSNKFFDKHTGNFNTAYERPLNRIVTGLIPVMFLANDAYNLSVLCGDKKEESNKEAKERTKQEISRVFTTAYIQLLTFGAFTKQVNTIPWFTALTSAATVLFSEVTSRKRLGKPIFFLNKEKAKALNEKNAKQNDKIQNNKDTKQTSSQPAQNTQLAQVVQQNVIENDDKFKNLAFDVNTDNSSIFTSFKASTDDKTAPAKDDNKTATVKDDNKSEKPKDDKPKALINFSTFKKGVAILISAGFALSFIKNSSLTKNSKIMKAFENFGATIKKKIYNPLAFKDFEITQHDFEVLTQALEDADCEKIAQGHKYVFNKYGKQTIDGTVKMYKASLESYKVPDVVNETLAKIKKSGINLSDEDIKKVSESVKTAIGLEKTSIAEYKYSNVANKATEIIRNKKVRFSPDEMENISNIITESIKSRVSETPIQVETKLKPFVDIVTQPFKFIMSTLKKPFELVSLITHLIVSPLEKKAADEAVGKATLTGVERKIYTAITEVFGKKKQKEGTTIQTVFVNAMEQIAKQTTAERKAIANHKGAAYYDGINETNVKVLNDVAEREKEKLRKYVNTAVEKSFNSVTQSSNKNTDLAMMSKLASSAVTSAFLVADNYNMVMLKSNGEDKEGAKEKANERIIQRLSALFYQSLLINWFNATFRSTYNSSLKGMVAVAIPNTLTTEVLTRKSIGMPIGRKSIEQLNEIDEKNENRKGFVGRYFKFMRLLTGKKPLKDRLPKDKQVTKTEVPNLQTQQTVQNVTTAYADKGTTNLLEILSK